MVNATRQTAIESAENTLDGESVKNNHYAPKEVVDLLRAYSLDKDIYDGSVDSAKCYYCESAPEVVASLQVEHYRPKKEIHDKHRRAIPDEEPDLLHPEIDNADLHLEFQPDGSITYKTPRGKRTIDICKLNREQLKIARRGLIEHFLYSFGEVPLWEQASLISEDQVEPILIKKCEALKDRYSRSKPYTLLMKNMTENPTAFFVHQIPAQYQSLLQSAFNAVFQGQ